MLVGGQRLGNSPFLHDDESGAVSQAPFLVRALAEQSVRGLEQPAIEGDDFNVRVSAQPIDELWRSRYRGRPWN